MLPNEAKKLLRAHGIGGLFGSGIKIFDTEGYVPSFAELSEMVDEAMHRLATVDDLVPRRDYEKNDADCDNWAVWIWSDTTKLWAKQNRGGGNKQLYFGFCFVAGHALNLGLCVEGVRFWDYGEFSPGFSKKVKEVWFV